MTDAEMAELRALALKQASANLEYGAMDTDALLRCAEIYFTFLMRGEPRTNLNQL